MIKRNCYRVSVPLILGGAGGKGKTCSRGLVGFCFRWGDFFIEIRFWFGLVWFGAWLARARGGGEEGIYCCLRIYCVLDFAGESREC